MNLKLKFRKNKNDHEKRPALWDTVTSLCCKPLCHSVQALTLDSFCSKALITLVPFFQMVWIAEFTRHNSRHRSAFFFPFTICRITVTFPSTLKTSFPLKTVAMSSCDQSPVYSRSRKVRVEGNFTHKANYHYYGRIPGLEFM